MRTLVFAFAVASLAASCGTSPPPLVVEREAEPVTAGPTTPEPPTPEPGTCLPGAQVDAGHWSLEALALEGRALHFCRREDDGAGCYALELDTGAMSGRPVPAGFGDDEDDEPAVVPAGQRELSYDEDQGTLSLCDAEGDRCRRLDLGKGDVALTWAERDATGERVLAVVSSADGDDLHLLLFRARDRKRLARVPISNDDESCGSARFVGPSVLVIRDVCAGPGGTAWLVKADTGATIGPVGRGDAWNAWDVDVAHLEGDRWAFREAGGEEVVVHDVRTGELVKVIDLRDTHPREGDFVLSDPSLGAMFKTAAGELVVVHDGVGQGRVVLVDPAAGAVTRVVRMPFCVAD